MRKETVTHENSPDCSNSQAAKPTTNKKLKIVVVFISIVDSALEAKRSRKESLKPEAPHFCGSRLKPAPALLSLS